MNLYKIKWSFQKQKGNKENSVSEESILLEQEDAEIFIIQFRQLQEELNPEAIDKAVEVKKIKEFIAPFRSKDISASIQYLEIKTHLNLMTDTLRIQSDLPL